jgi:hypothetical protein
MSDLLRAAKRMPVRISLVIYTAIIVIATLPTWDVYMWFGHYQIFPAANLYEVCKVWSAEGFGHVPWFPDSCFGYGYPFLTFYSPLGYYVGAVFHFIFALDYGPATKLSFYASLYLSGLLMYAFVYLVGSRERWPRLAWWALAAATVYALTRYHLTDIFVRDTIGESWAWATLPGVYLGMELARRQPGPGILLTSLMFAGLLLSHNITALWASVFIPAYPLLTARDLKWPLTVAAGGILGLALSAFFWYPGLRLAGLTLKAGDMNTMWATPQDLHRQALLWREHFVEALGYGGKGPGTDNTLGANIGFAVLISLLLAFVSIFHRGFTRRQRQRLAVFVSLTFLILFIMSPQMPWNKIPSMLRYVQFPWRLLIFTAFFGSSAAAMAAPVINRWIHPMLLTGFAVLFAIPTLPMILPPPVIKQMSPNQLERWINRWERAGLYAGSLFQVFTPKWVQGEYRNPKFLAEHPVPKNRLTVISGDMVCNGYTHSGRIYQYRYWATVDSEACIAVFYWPGWELRIDGNRDPGGVKLGKDGLVQIRLPAGSHRAELRYSLSPEGKFARVVSSIAAIVWAAMLLFWIFSRWLSSWFKLWRWKRMIAEPMPAAGP